MFANRPNDVSTSISNKAQSASSVLQAVYALHGVIELLQYGKFAYCMQDVHNILLYCNTGVVVIKPVTGRASTCSASLKTTRLIALGFHTRKRFVNIHIPVIQFQFTQYMHVKVSVLNCIALCRIAILLHILIYFEGHATKTKVPSN